MHERRIRMYSGDILTETDFADDIAFRQYQK